MSDRKNTCVLSARGQERGSTRLSKSNILGLAFIVIIVGAAVLLMVWTRAFYGSAEAYRKGEESLRENQVMQAITYFDRAIHWYTPFNPYVERSAQRLWSLSESSKMKGEYTLALAALSSLKSGYVAAAGLYTPGGDWIERCEDQIEMLSKLRIRQNPLAEPRSYREDEGLQKQAPPPSVFWTIILEIGLLGWIGWIFWMIARFRKKERLFPTLLKWGCPLLLFYSLWIIGMMKA